MDAHIRIELDVDELVSQLFQTVFRVDNTSTAVMTIADVSATTMGADTANIRERSRSQPHIDRSKSRVIFLEFSHT